jgi:dolichol kinase
MVLLALLFKNTIIFAAAMLELGVADGLAAVIGTRYGKKTRFKVLGQTKSRHGTATFFICSLAIIFWAVYSLHSSLIGFDVVGILVTFALSVGVSLTLTAAELVGVKGSDNITVPFIAAVSLHLLK